MDLNARIDALTSTTFCGRRFSRLQIFQIVDTVSTFGKLSRQELAFTLCEHLAWNSPGGKPKVNSALRLLDKFEALGLCTPPPVKVRKRGKDMDIGKVILLTPSVEPPPVHSNLSEISPVSLKLVEQADERQRFKALMATHHDLDFKRPFGAHLQYFIVDKDGRELGLMMFAASAWSLKARDEWIGWQRKHRLKRLHRVVCNSRFLIFPWVNVANLASQSLALVTAQLAGDWQARYGYRPVLIETFVDRQHYRGTCYKAANWQKVGETTGRGRFDEGDAVKKSIKDIYLQPLVPNFRDVLLRDETEAQVSTTTQSLDDNLCRLHDNVLSFWAQVAPLIRSIAQGFDSTWQIKRRVIDSLLLVLLIFRLVATRAKHGYGTTIDELWDNCRKQGLRLPQKEPIAASAFTVARQKLDEQIFKTINSRVISHHDNIFDRDEFRFFGHRLYAVDGSKLNLPRTLIKDGFKTPNEATHYPQGLLSSLYRLKAQMPMDFLLTADCNERRAALTHLTSLAADDVVVYDRGYFSYGLLHAHLEKNIHAVFRLSRVTYKVIREFMESTDSERIVVIEPKSKKRLAKIRKSYPGIFIKPLSLRLIKYEIADVTYYLGTTLIHEHYPRESFNDLYHARWGIEELYKISKQFIAIEDFHAKSVRGVRQEIYAHLTLITLNRILTNHTDNLHHPEPDSKRQSHANTDKITTNFKNSMAAVARNLESLILDQAQALGRSVLAVLSSLSRRYQAIRPNRSYPRRSFKPQSKWRTTTARKIPVAA